MQMNLKSFENDVENKIVERGLNYYRSGDVKKLEKVGENEFSAVVFGSEKYSIYVKINGDAIIEHECDCPYDWGNVCKHEVAVFYALRNGNFTDTSDKLNSLLENLHESALRKFVQKRLAVQTRIFARIRRRF